MGLTGGGGWDGRNRRRRRVVKVGSSFTRTEGFARCSQTDKRGQIDGQGEEKRGRR